MAAKTGWGILSTARHGVNTLIPAIRESGNSDLVAIASRDIVKAKEVAASHHVPASYGTYEALLADPNVDVVYIPLPNNLHKEWAVRAAQAGKHVLCEKPFALNAAEAADMVAAFRAAGLKLAEAFQWRHHPQGQQMRDMIRTGEIGDLRFIDAGFSFMLLRENDFRQDPVLGGGALYDVGCYPISLVRYLTGHEPLAVTAQMHWNAAGIDDLAVATLEFPGEVFATINCSFILPLRRYGEAVGTRGSLLVEKIYNPTNDFSTQIVRRGPDREVVETIDLGRKSSYALMVRDFSRAVLENRDPVFPAEDGVANMRVIDAIFKSARTGRKVRL